MVSMPTHITGEQLVLYCTVIYIILYYIIVILYHMVDRSRRSRLDLFPSTKIDDISLN